MVHKVKQIMIDIMSTYKKLNVSGESEYELLDHFQPFSLTSTITVDGFPYRYTVYHIKISSSV